MLAVLSIAELLGMSLWFAGSAVAPELQALWALSPSQTGWLTAIVQVGFVAGTATAAILNLADIIPTRRYFAVSAILAALANAALAVAPSYEFALASRFITGAFLAGVYPPALKMISTWFRARRGLAIGTVVGALTAGKAMPYLLHALPDVSVAGLVLAASSGALLAASLVWISYHDGPHAFPARPFSWALAGGIVRERPWRLATGGYLGHMFELYSFWSWIPAALAASEAMRVHPDGQASRATISLLTFAAIGIGAAGCVWGGLAADRMGRERVVTIAMAASGACAILTSVSLGADLWIIAPIVLVWGFFVVADSAQFSAMVTESVPPHAIGTALTIQISLGFLLTAASIQLVPPMVAAFGWRWALAMLALGPVAGIAAIRRLVAWRASRPGGGHGMAASG
jgi:MFS family permease